MPSPARISFYEVSQCGYYRRGRPRPEFGSLPEILIDLNKWAPGIPFNRTATYSPASSGKYYESYCFDVKRLVSSGDLFLTLWIRTETAEGRVASIRGNSRLGELDIRAEAVPQGFIPGAPAYFWIIPSQRQIACIRFDRQLLHRHDLNRYMKGFMQSCSRFVVGDTSRDGVKTNIRGYSAGRNQQIYSKMYERFSTKPVKHAPQIELIRRRRGDIRKVILKKKLSWSDPVQAGTLDHIRRLLGLLEVEHPQELSHKFNSTIEMTPTSAELDSIIEGYEEGDGWEDIAFAMKGGAIYWLSSMNKTSTHDLGIAPMQNGIYPLHQIIEAVHPLRNRLLGVS